MKNKKGEKQKKPVPPPETPENPSGFPGEMKAIGESISGEQPEIGEKDTGIGRKVNPPQPPASGPTP